MKIRVNLISSNISLVDGPGIRTVLFLQGCDVRCPGCHNQETWDPNGGYEMDTKELAEQMNKIVTGKKLTISGGEPLMQQEAVIDLVNRLDNFDIVLYTSHNIEDVDERLLKKLKYIKCGRYIKALKTTTTPYVGSTNQTFKKVD